MTKYVLIAAGANIAGNWGEPVQSLLRALDQLTVRGITLVRTSQFYRSAPAGGLSQPDYTNCVLAVRTARPPEALLRVLQDIEQAAGRRSGRMWASRPLDLDIICYKGRVLGWRRVRRLEPQRGRPDSTSPHLILPHPRAHHRGFVMQPLAEICPRWHHPVFGNTAGQMLSGLAAGRSPLQIAG